jgi:hypothetical protein
MTMLDPDSRTFASPAEAYRHGIALWREGRRAPALELLEGVLDGLHGPLDHVLERRVFSRLLTFASALGWPRKEELSRRATAAFPKDAFGWRHLGEALLRQDRFEDAEAPLLEAIGIDPEDEDARLLLVMARRRVNPSEEQGLRARPWPDRQHLFDDPRRLLKLYLLRGYPERRFVRPDTVFMTLGSCFAENLARRLGDEGLRVHSEPIGEEVNSTYANRYLLKWVEQGPVDGPTRVIDEIFGPQRRERLRRALTSSEALVLTLGVAPCFFDRETGEFAFSALRSPTGHQYLQQRCVMRTTTVAENVTNIQEILSTAERIAGRPHEVVLTVSPVALAGTTEFYSAVTADCLSKSTLRLACQEVIEQRPELIYWPSFEIVRWLGVHYTREDAPVFGAEDGSTRHVSNWLVELIVQLFLERHRLEQAGSPA